ncbi:MAG: endonuclease MutS2 [Acutalibacteraceae bacterium]|nr:endonuclease MutS2 [Acutalibacteraceae bacterium]
MDRNLKALELDKILIKLSEETAFADAKQSALELRPANDLYTVNKLLKQTDDAYMLSGRFGSPSFGGITNVVNSLKRAEAGGCLTMGELLKVAEALRVIRGLKQWRDKSSGIETVLDVYFNTLTSNKFLEEKIFTSIISEEEMSDMASVTLSAIRKKIKQTSAKARDILDKMVRSQTYQKFLQDPIVTIRDGRFVVPVKAECRGEIPGLVHDTSSSGATVFVEPMGAVEANNAVKVLKSKEEAEIERILFELSATAGGYAQDIINSYYTATQLDVIFAKASLAYKMKASMPIMNDSGIINLNKARHPLIDKDKVVPISVYLGEEFNSLVITGPNTGGKTVTLKTIGLLTAMAMCGLMIPAGDESRLSVFDKILVDIGDEQSIEQSLSTFSAHMTNIIRILDQTDDKSLVLIDELGAGTDPVEGAGLAIAILEQLRNQGAKIASTTHYAELKEYALQSTGVENACCEFDVATLQPTYKLLIGVPGRSNAFAISERLGMDKALVDKARKLVSDESRRFEDVVEKLENQRQTLDEKIKYAERVSLQAQKERENVQREIEQLRKQAEFELKKAREEAMRITSTTRATADALIEELNDLQKHKQLTPEEKAKLRADIRNMENNADPVEKAKENNYTLPRALKKGDRVLIFDIDKKAVVAENPKGDSVLVQAGIMKIKVNIDNLRLLEDKKKPQVQHSTKRNIRSNATVKAVTDIDLRGMTAMEAIMELDRQLDSATLSGIHQVTIIHGKGTGVLRKEVHNYLKRCKYVKTYRLGVFGEGEAGVTIAELK